MKRLIKILSCLFCLVNAGCSDFNTVNGQPPPPKYYRFKIVENINFIEGTYPSEAYIIQDKKTGVKYIYYWGGTRNGGPTITRLWDK